MKNMRGDIKNLLDWKKQGRKIAIYCAGRHGTILFELLKKCSISADCFLDSNKDKWGQKVIEDCICVNPQQIMDKDNYIVFICIAPAYYEKIYCHVSSMGYHNIASLNDLTDDIITNNSSLYLDLIEWFHHFPPSEFFYTPKPNSNDVPLNEMPDTFRSKIAVYTGAFGGYDDMCKPAVTPANIDYYYISDEKPEDIYPYVWIDAKKIIPSNIHSPIKRNRYIKMHPHLLFPDYKYSIYVDGNIKIKGDLSCFMPSKNPGISVFMHPNRDCLFYEGITIVNFRRVTAADVCKQMKRYLNEGMPIHYGLAEMGVIARNHMEPVCIKIMEEWWDEFNKEAQRDQLSFMYVMWKNGLDITDLCSLGSNCRKNPLIEIKKHDAESLAISNTFQPLG